MSTRESIYYANGIHVYKEQMDEEICAEFDYTLSDHVSPKANEKYGSFTMPKSAWEELAKQILEKLEAEGDGE